MIIKKLGFAAILFAMVLGVGRATVFAELDWIGVTGISSALKQPDLKIVMVGNKYPDKQTVMTGEYPYFRPLFLFSKTDSRAEVNNFLEFALRMEGQDVISRQGTINLAEGRELKNIAELEGLLC